MKASEAHVGILELTTANFEETVIQDGSPILIDFWAAWCGPCRMMAPILDEAAQSLQGIARVAKLNVDKEGAVAEAFGIRGIPTLVLMKGGKVVDAVSGVMPAADLVDRVKNRLGK